MRTRFLTLWAIAGLVLAAAAPVWAVDTPPRHDFPRVGPYEVITGDFHMHTVHSDGRLITRERVEESYALGYDAIAITDHGNSKAYRVARYVGGSLGTIVLCGFETGVANQEHMNVLGVSASHTPRNPHRWAEKPGDDNVFYQDEMRRIAADGGIIIYNHPHKGFREPVKSGIDQGLLIGIEVKNDVVGKGWNTVESHGTHCYPDAFDWALEHNLALFANTDVHGRRSDRPATTLLWVREKTPEGVMDAFRGRRTAAWFDGMIWGREALLAELIGTTVVATSSGTGTRLANQGPVPLKGSLGGGKTFELPAYGEASVDAAAPLDVTWTNVWISRTANLKTRVGKG